MFSTGVVKLKVSWVVTEELESCLTKGIVSRRGLGGGCFFVRNIL